MTKSKVLDLAREVGMEDDKLLLKLKRMGVKVKDKNVRGTRKKVSPSDEKIIERDSEKEIVEKRVKPTVIRRRARRFEVKEETPPPPLSAVVEPEAIEEKIPKRERERKKPKPKPKIPKKAAGKEELEKEEKPPAKPAKGRKKKAEKTLKSLWHRLKRRLKERLC